MTVLAIFSALVALALAGSERARAAMRRRNAELVSQREFYARAADTFAANNLALRRQIEKGNRSRGCERSNGNG